MIITCPQCAKKFHLKEKALPQEPFKVRCSSCSLTWRVSPPPTERQSQMETELAPDQGEKYREESPHAPNEFLKQLRDDSIPEEDDSFSRFTPFPPRLEEEPIKKQSFAERIKIDWIVLGLGIIIFLFVFLLDNFYQGSFFSNLTRKDNYSVDRKNAELQERKEETTLPQYPPKPRKETPSSPFTSSIDSFSPFSSDKPKGY